MMESVVGSGGRTFSKLSSFEDHAVLTIEEIQNVVGEKVGSEYLLIFQYTC